MDRLMLGVIPYLAIDGCETAIAFYRKAFGATLLGEAVKDQSGTVMNATLAINGGAVMLMDTMPGIGDEGMAATARGLTMQIVTRDGDLWWNRAVAAGCTVTKPFGKEFWGDRYGRLMDPFGIAWAVDEPGEGK
jgi:PhnB protein